VVHFKNQHSGYRKTLAVFSELQAVAGGTAVLQESKDLEKDSQLPGTTLVCRDTANTADLLMDTSKRIFSVVDFFRPDRQSGIPSKVELELKSYIDNRKQVIISHLAHVARGRSRGGK
jgi:hypothetical protein